MLSAAPSPSFYGQPVTFTAAVSALPPGVGLPGGLVTFRDGATVLGASTLDASGLATFTSAGAAPGALLAGDHQITAAYEGDASFEPRTATPFTHVVTAAAAELVASVSPALASSGQAVTIRATVSSPAGTPGGQVDFLENGVTLLGSAALDAAGQASLSIATLAVGVHPISVRYAGAADYQPVATQVTAVVEPAATTTTLVVAPAAPVVGQPVTLTATLQVVAPGAGSPGGAVTFLDGTTVLGTAPVDGAGVATLATTALGRGAHLLGASYPGDDRFGPSVASTVDLTTGRAAVEVAVEFSPSPTVIGQAVTVSVVVTAAAPGAGTPTGTVDLRDGNVLVTSMTLAAGRGTATTTTLAAGAKMLTAAYAGDADYLPGSASAAHTVARASTATALRSSAGPARFGQPVTFTATVAAVAPGAGHPAGRVTFRDGGDTLGTAGLDSVGVATLTLSSLAVGLHTITASFPGDPSFGPSSGAFDQDVLRAGATAQVAASPSPAMVGQAVTFTVALSAVAPSAGVPGGTVTVRDGPTVLGTAAVGPSGVATFTTTSLGAGDHQVTVEYGGDLGFGPTSAEARISVEAGSTGVTIESDRNPSRRGRPVTFTAMVTSPHLTPTGTVAFMDGTTLLGTATLDGNGMASFTTRDLVKGTHPVSAEFDGGQAFAAAGVDLDGGQVVENTPPVAGAGTALSLGAGHAAAATAAAAGALDQPIGTVELWARTRATLDARQASRLAASAAAPGGTLLSLGGDGVRWALGLDAARTGLVVTLAGATTTVPAAFADGGWHHLALVASEASATVLVDGVEAAVLDGHFDATVMGERLEMGQGLDGELDEVRLWATPRTTAQLAADARRPLGGTEPWLLGLWRMDEGTGGELFDAGPLHLDATVDLGGVEDATAFAPSAAWRHRDAWQERDLAPAVDAGYDADGDALTLALTAPPSHGAATLDHPSLQVAYRAGTGHLGLDQFSYGLSDGAASSEYLIEVSVARILSCQADADCGGGDLCILSACVAPDAVEARAAGCGCTSGGGEALGLWSLLALCLGTLRRARRTAPQAGRKS
ncbi:MAG: Ig-like domain repeat protein [Anaeromyxobacter sp.]|nr:Ig-like domain repeat protein [Anaeromyxobacter sp.]